MDIRFPSSITNPVKGADISSCPDATGTWFHACFGRDLNDGIDKLILWKQFPDGTTKRIEIDDYTARGQLTWCPAGLVLSAWDTAKDDGTGAVSAKTIMVPEYVNWGVINSNLILYLRDRLKLIPNQTAPIVKAIVDILRVVL